MPDRKISLSHVLSILTFLLVAAAPAGAIRPEASPGEFLLRAPEARAQSWRDGLLKFLAEHRDFTSEQLYAIESLAEIENPAAFASTLQPHQRDLFAQRFAELGRVLPYRDYLSLLRSFDDELRLWLDRNGLGSITAAVTVFCNCTQGQAGGCAGGYMCCSATCINDGTTTHNGICAVSNCPPPPDH